MLRCPIILCTAKRKIALIKLRHSKDCKTGGNFREREKEREKPDLSPVRKGSVSHSRLEISYVFIWSYFSFGFK